MLSDGVPHLVSSIGRFRLHPQIKSSGLAQPAEIVVIGENGYR